MGWTVYVVAKPVVPPPGTESVKVRSNSVHCDVRLSMPLKSAPARFSFGALLIMNAMVDVSDGWGSSGRRPSAKPTVVSVCRAWLSARPGKLERSTLVRGGDAGAGGAVHR